MSVQLPDVDLVTLLDMLAQSTLPDKQPSQVRKSAPVPTPAEFRIAGQAGNP